MQIARVTPEQHESLIDLLCELHAHYNFGEAVPREVVRTHLKERLLAADSPLWLVVAKGADRRVVGVVALELVYSIVEPSESSRQCQVKELFVASSSRRSGVGRHLMQWAASFAAEHGCCRIDWPVKASNVEGRRFYEELGAAMVVDRLSYRLEGESLAKLANPA